MNDSFETERLVLRPPTLDDFEDFAAMCADPEVMRYIASDGQALSRFAAWQSLCSAVGHRSLRGYGMFAVIERQTGSFVGRVGPWFPEGWVEFEVGWTIRSKCWGRGYATEAAKACIAYSFNELGRTHLVSLILPGNVRSIRVAEKAGERLECETTLPHLPPETTVLQYGLHRNDWLLTQS